MRNLDYFPFERNKYFYGKLLSVEDFNLEQKYSNDKRRMLNRFLYGTGVISGLSVVEIDEQTISVERGIALDYSGREIVVDVPFIKKLSMIEGFEACTQSEEQNYMYLCIDYDEKEIEVVHNIVENMSYNQDDSKQQFNKIKETYRLYLTNSEPTNEKLSAMSYYEEPGIVFSDRGVKIKHIVPKYVKIGEMLTFKVQIENTERSNVAFSYDLLLNGLLCDGQPRLHVTFDELLFEKTGKYELEYQLEASQIAGIEANLTIDSGTIRYVVSGMQRNVTFEGMSKVKIISGEESNEVIDNYFKSSMELNTRTDLQMPVYLAKIFIVKADNAYNIDRIEDMPYKQYVMNNMLINSISEMMRKGITDTRTMTDLSKQESINKKVRNENSNAMIAQGVETINFNSAAHKGDIFYSREITHGLMLGETTIILGVEDSEEEVVFGAANIFGEKAKSVQVAASLNQSKGTFVIGVQMLASTSDTSIKVHWTAIRNMKESIQEKGERRIFIKPNVLELRVRETYQLEAICKNMIEKAVTWKVGVEGGNIDQKGLYTAPNIPGVYEVMAQSVSFPEVKASIFIVVREE